jgi:hypothetical protein
MSKRPTKRAQKAINAKRDKDRRQSRDFEAVRRDLDTINAANRLRSSQLSQYSQPGTFFKTRGIFHGIITKDKRRSQYNRRLGISNESL